MAAWFASVPHKTLDNAMTSGLKVARDRGMEALLGGFPTAANVAQMTPGMKW